MSGMGSLMDAGGHMWLLASPVGTALTVTGNVTPSYCRFTTATDTAGMRRSSWASGSASAGRTSARAGRRGDVRAGGVTLSSLHLPGVPAPPPLPAAGRALTTWSAVTVPSARVSWGGKESDEGEKGERWGGRGALGRGPRCPGTPHPTVIPASGHRGSDAGGAEACGSAARRRAGAGMPPAPQPGSPCPPAATTGSSAQLAPVGSALTRPRAPLLRMTTPLSPCAIAVAPGCPTLHRVPPSPALTGAQRQPQQDGSPAPLGLKERREAGPDTQCPAVPSKHSPAQAVHSDVGHLQGHGGVRPVPTRSMLGPDKPPALSPGAGAHLPAEAAVNEGVHALVGLRPGRCQQVPHPTPEQRL